MITAKAGRVLVTAPLLLPAFVLQAETIVQDPEDHYVSFQAGQYDRLFNPGTSIIEDNLDGTLTTVEEGDHSSLATYNLQFANAGDYFLYFRMEDVGEDSVFVNHATGFDSVPGDSDAERWHGLDTGWNGLFGILGDQTSYDVPAGDPAWGWNVAAPSTVSFTVRNREAGVVWKDFVFSQKNNLTALDLYRIIGVAPPAVIEFEYTQNDKETGFGTLSGLIDGITFRGDMPAATVSQNAPDPLPVPPGMIGYMNGWSESQPGNPFGVYLGWSGSVTLQGEKQISPDEVEYYELDVPLVISEDGAPHADWWYEVDITDDGDNGNDAFGSDLRLAAWIGDPTSGHRQSAGVFGQFIEGAVDTRTIVGTHGDVGQHGEGDQLGIAISLRNANGTGGPGRLADEGSGVIYVDNLVWHGGFTVDRSTIRRVPGGTALQAGDADQDFKFDQLDFLRVLISAKYLTGRPATWGEGDWDGAPGGEPGNPPPGNGRFDQLDIVAALRAAKYLTGPYHAVAPGLGDSHDEPTSIVYSAERGEDEVNAPVHIELTPDNIDSEAGTLGKWQDAQNLAGGRLGDVDLLDVPEPSTMILLTVGALLLGRRFVVSPRPNLPRQPLNHRSKFSFTNWSSHKCG